MLSFTSATTGILLRHRPFLFYFASRGLSKFCYQIGAVAVGWQVYALTGSAFDLGMVGLVQFIPTALLTFAAGHVADRYSRKRVAQLSQFAAAVAAAFLAWGSFSGWLSVPQIFAAVAVFGVAIAFESPAAAAILPAVAPEGDDAKSGGALHRSVSDGDHRGSRAGRADLCRGARRALYSECFLWFLAALLSGAIALDRPIAVKQPSTIAGLFAGVEFVRNNPAILGSISLDLFAVLFGGATALLPIYARDILHTGPWGLGVLRGAPAVGALLMGLALARYPINRRVGMRMFQAVIIFGLATVVFALSSSIWLSLLALAVLGAADMVSMVVRIALRAIVDARRDARPRRGGELSVRQCLRSSLGEFESGVTAALLGAVPAAALGGIGTIVVALLWMKFFPALRDVERLE